MCCSLQNSTKSQQNRAILPVTGLLFFSVDNPRGRSLYTTHRRAVPQVTARWRASETPHWFSENASDSIRTHEFRWRVWLPCRDGKLGIARSPGCLTSESEERETWTAGSLRTGSFVSKQFNMRHRSEETSDGLRFQRYIAGHSHE